MYALKYYIIRFYFKVRLRVDKEMAGAADYMGMQIREGTKEETLSPGWGDQMAPSQ